MGVGLLTLKTNFLCGFCEYFDNIGPVVILLALVPHNVNYKNNNQKLMTATYIPAQQKLFSKPFSGFRGL